MIQAPARCIVPEQYRIFSSLLLQIINATRAPLQAYKVAYFCYDRNLQL